MKNHLQIISTIAVVNYKNKYLLVKRHKEDIIFPGKWQNVGGKIELGETVEEALLREVKEETNIQIAKNTNLSFIKSYSWRKSKKDPVRLGLIFLIVLKKEPTNIEICQELEDYGWFTIKEIEEMDIIGKTSPTGTLGQILSSQQIQSK